jgi:hypothetical protein
MKRLVLAALALALSAGTAFAGLDENVMAPGGPGEFKHQGPVATVEAYSSLIYRHTRMDIFFAGGGRFVVRRAEDHMGKDATVRWTSSEACPALSAVLTDLQQLKAPLIELPGFKHPVEGELVLDGISYSLWTTAGRYDGGRARGGVEMTGNVDSPLARWAQSADERLAGCWGDAKPAEE